LIEDQDGVMLGKMTRKEGEELATERGFHLLEETLPKRSAKTEDGVPKYKLVKELPSKSQKKPAKKKMLKQLKLRSKISDHDLAIKLKHVDEWLRKEHEVIVSLENADPSNPKVCIFPHLFIM
jgi:translation initiation factor IF-3